MTIFEEEQALAERLHKVAPVLAKTLTELDAPHTWTAKHELVHNDYPGLRIGLSREDGFSFGVYTGRYDKTAECSISFPLLPDGSDGGYRATKLREFLSYEESKNMALPDREASVSRERLLNDPAKVAREYYRRVIAPNAPFWPKVVANIAERQAAVAKRDVVIAKLLQRFPGARTNQHDSGGTRTIYIPNLPTITVSYGGGVSFERGFGGTEELICKILDLVANERSRP